jgi:hypothetical protein
MNLQAQHDLARSRPVKRWNASMPWPDNYFSSGSKKTSEPKFRRLFYFSSKYSRKSAQISG